MDRQFTTGFKDAQPLWLSSYQLLVHFQLFSGSIGPVCAHKQWFAGEDRLDQTPLLNTIFLQQATWWSHYLRRIGTAFGLEVKPTPGRPAGTSLAIWTRCFYIRFSPTAVAGWTDGFCHIQDGQWGRLDRKWKISPPHYGEGDHDLRWQPSLFHQRRTSEPNEKRRNGMIEGFWTLLKWGCPKIQRWWFFIRKTMEHQLWGANLEKTGTRWSSWNAGLRTTPQLRIFTLDPSAKSFHKFSSFNQQNEVIMNSYLARIQGLNILCTSKNVGLLNLQLLRSFFHTFCYQKKRPCLPPPRPGPSLRSQSKPGGKRRHPTRPALRRCGGGVSGHCGELHRSMHHQPTFGDSGRCPKCGEKYWDPWKNPWKSRKTDWNGWCLVIFADFVIFEMHVLTDSTGSNIDGLLIGLGDWIGNIDWNRWSRGNQY